MLFLGYCCMYLFLSPVHHTLFYCRRRRLLRVCGLGAGLIKIRGDKVWKDLTAMDYHYETQPLPNPISYFLHQAPKKFHRYSSVAVAVVHFCSVRDSTVVFLHAVRPNILRSFL